MSAPPLGRLRSAVLNVVAGGIRKHRKSRVRIIGLGDITVDCEINDISVQRPRIFVRIVLVVNCIRPSLQFLREQDL